MQILRTIELPELGKKYKGKVRDCYVLGDKRVLVTTDRISAFDQNLGYIPYKGQVLNQLSAFWFEKTKDIIQNHMISAPDPNVMIAKNTKPILIEMIVRGYITGVTGTSIWGSYANGEREIYGITFPDGLSKNQKLPHPVITPTTKPEVGHDARLTRTEIMKSDLVSKKHYEAMEEAAMSLYMFGEKFAKEKGLLLVDTKYEFGVYENEVMLIDELHTPDSSRYWIEATYEEKFRNGIEPENFDKEFLRLWYKERGYMGDGVPPRMDESFIKEVSSRYITCYETLTGKKFSYPKLTDIEARIRKNLSKSGILEGK